MRLEAPRYCVRCLHSDLIYAAEGVTVCYGCRRLEKEKFFGIDRAAPTSCATKRKVVVGDKLRVTFIQRNGKPTVEFQVGYVGSEGFDGYVLGTGARTNIYRMPSRPNDARTFEFIDFPHIEVDITP